MAVTDFFTCCTGVFFVGIPLLVIVSLFIRVIYDYQKGLVLTLG
jgi:hypothetical protein